MTCKDGSCDLPTAAQFNGRLRVAAGSQAAPPAVRAGEIRTGPANRAPRVVGPRWPPPALRHGAGRNASVRSHRAERRAGHVAADDSGLQLFGWIDSERHALRAAGHRAEDFVVRRTRRTQRPADSDAQFDLCGRHDGRLFGLGHAGRDAEFELGPALQLDAVHDHARGAGLCHGPELFGRLGDSDSRLCRLGRGGRGRPRARERPAHLPRAS